MQEYTLQVFVICLASAFTNPLKQFALIGIIELAIALSLFLELYPSYEKTTICSAGEITSNCMKNNIAVLYACPDIC